ncbi:allantoin permease [Halalkalicoccus paucihalophilus]|uniref:Allantoin permease n=1 Tax=Halalkalicoccus paucihalophilus TaxID=1008153 RepID=A0A151AAK0_9EURY|nr:cytosine permease [Halalkalicoccus paucihalophilus]KYH24728.1 allantoin permease [Halalkalicoccus paucihalophilus]
MSGGDEGENAMTESQTESLEPIADEHRSMSLSHYIPVWWASFIIVQGFATAFFAVYPQGPLNLLQAAVAMTIGATVSAILFTLNGVWGYEMGIPFVAQTRAAFGIRGSVMPNLVRVIPAVGWLGIGNWIGALAINSITTTLWGFGHVPLYFILFLLLNIALAWGGITSIKWFDSLAAGVIIVLLTYTVYVVLSTQGIASASLEYDGTWGLPFLTVIAAHVGTAITGALNAADISRHLKKRRGSWNHILGHLLGIAPAMLYMALVGLVFGISTDTANPVYAIMKVAPSPAIGIAMLVFVLAAQISSNLTLNIVPPIHVFQDSLGISWQNGLLVTGILSVATFPWVLFSAEGGIYFLFINSYAVPLGPILGILLADYWIFRAEDTSIPSLYDKHAGSKYWFIRGFSVTAVASTVIGSVASLLLLDLSWMIGLPVGFVSYVVLRKGNLDERSLEYLSSTRA